MAKFELNIYGEDDEIIKKYETDHIRFGVLVEAAKITDMTDDKTESIKKLVKRVFVGLTDEEIMLADWTDVVNTFIQVSAMAGNINSSKN
ncbi:MAG: hypothetical protein II685_04630 [Clostridia bacterium]|nr:hypothetical protein [Clostridia bacterium]